MQENRSTEQNRIRAISLVLAVIIWRGTSIPVALAKDFMTADERVEMLAAAREGFAPRARVMGAGQGVVCGKIRTEDGKELPEKVVLISRVRTGGCLSTGLVDVSGHDFRAETDGGDVYFIATAEDYAPAFVGPYRLLPDRTIGDVTIVLPVGFDAAIRVEDEEGRPIEGAAVRGWPARYGDVFFRTLERMAGDDKGLLRAGRMIEVPATNEEGLAPATHLAGEPYRFEIRAAGYQMTEQEVSLAPKRTTVIRLKKARPFAGRAVSVTGEPVTDAEVRLAWRSPLVARLVWCMSGNAWDRNRVVAKTDESGRFTLDELNDSFAYTLRIDSKRWGLAVVKKVLAGEERTITVGPKLTIHGTISGPLDQLRKEAGKPYVTVAQWHRYELGRHRVFVHVNGETASFDDSALVPGKVTVRAGDHEAETTVGPESPTATVRFHLNAPVPAKKPLSRNVALTFACGGLPVGPKGAVVVWGSFSRNPLEKSSVFPVSNGIVKMDIPAGRRFTCKPGDIVGWYFDTVYPDVEPGEGPLKVTIPVRPAGAAMGRIIVPPGFVRKGVDVFPSLFARFDLDDDRSEEIKVSINSEFRYFATPIPLGARCALKLTRGRYVFVTPHFQLDHAEPLREIDLRLPEPATARVRVTDADGRPATNVPIWLYWRDDADDTEEGLSDELWNAGNTDEKGRIAIANVNPDGPQYHIEVDSRQTWQPTRANLRTDGKETHIHLKRGHELAVTVLDDKTSLPVPGEVVSARLHPAPEAWLDRTEFEAETHTDQDGKCRFSNLPEGNVRLEVAGMHPPKEGDWDFDASREKKIVIRAVNYPRFVVGDEGVESE